MLSIVGGAPQRGRMCDGIARRQFLTIGGLVGVGGMGGLSMPQLLRADSAAGGSRRRSVIMIFLPGGPPHQDMFDLKPDAPSEVRGEFRPIATNVPGIQMCELLPRLARITDKLAIVRSIVGATGDH